MHLKNVYMENFKSFGKRKEIPIKEGYTNITGPNGSGKSNIGDAILFVLGPKSSKEIRAARLTDLIYNGGKAGKPADKCRVSLTFENSDRTIPMNEDEITFTRKVQRSNNNLGYNSYFYINGRSSSLTEFQELLSYAGITSDGYNLVQQGDIAKIVEMSDLERRRILDQISGITDYDKEIEKAEESKAVVETDLERINIILEEITKQVKELEADSREALKFKELSDRVEEAKRMKQWKTKLNVEKEISSIRSEIDDKLKEMEENKLKKEKISKELEELKRDISGLDSELEKRGGEKSKELQEKKQNVKLEFARMEDKIEELERKIDVNSQDRELYKEHIKSKKDELAELSSRLVDYNEEQKELVEKAHEVGEEIKAIKDKQSASDGRITGLRKEGVVINNKLNEKNDSLSKKSIEYDRMKDQLKRVRVELSEIEEELETLEMEKKDYEWTLKNIKKESKGKDSDLKELKDEFYRCRQNITRCRKDKKALEDALTRLQAEYSQMNAEEKAARSVRKGYNRAVEAILQARDTGELRGVHGTVAEIANVKKEYETALQVAAGGRMQSIVVDDDEVASQAIKLLKKKDAGRATFLPLNKMMPGRPMGKALRAVKDEAAVGFALDLVRYGEEYDNVFWYVFQDTVVMNDIDSARKLMGGVRMVTMEGENIERSGAMVGGNLSKNLLSFDMPDRGKIERVGKELTKTRENLEKVIKELDALEKELESVEKELMKVQTEDNDSQKIPSLEREIKTLNETIKKRKDAIKQKEKEINDADEKIQRYEESIDHIKTEMEELKQKRNEISEKIKKISPEELSRNLSDLMDREVDLNKKINELSTNIKLDEENKKRIEQDIKDIKSKRQELKDDISNCESEIKKGKMKIKDMSKEIETIEDELSSMDSELNSIRKNRDELNAKMNQTDKTIGQLDTNLEASKYFIRGKQDKLDQYQTTMDELEEEIGKDIDYSDEKLPSIKELKDTIRRGEEKMDSLGAVNMRAIQDHDQKKVRKEKLQEEYSALIERHDELNRLIKELDDKKKVGLLKVKNEINENFIEVYKELSDGGDANIELENPESPFEGGLVIKARPPGKKVHRIQALSGGEKGLVSMAFIFAIQKYDPSPFYLLDEIDQNLDAVNAEKVASMIKRNSKSAQFIQVSLRKATLKRSDHIIGVTINNKGLSDVIMMVDLGKEEESDLPELSGMSKLETGV